jgi:probable rRNA maturation factor
MTIQIFNQTDQDVTSYEDVLNHVFSLIEEEKSLNIVIITSEEMQNMNKTFRGLDKPTDVLSFPYDEPYLDELGDIFINLLYMKEQAQSYGHSEAREIAFLAVHGYLHVKGYDHHTEEEENMMFEKQETILTKAGLERNK